MKMLTRKQVAAVFSVKTQTIYQWEKKGLLKPDFYTVGRKPRYSEERISALYLEKQKTVK